MEHISLVNKRSIVAIGPRGGRIVGYDAQHNPIYGTGSTKPQDQLTTEQQVDKTVQDAYESLPLNVLQKLASLEQEVIKKGDSKSKFKAGNRYSTARASAHQKIFEQYTGYFNQARPKSGTPKVIFMAGLPASGKSYAVKSQFKEVPGTKGRLMADNKGQKYLVVNPDDFKKEIPEYNGLNSAYVHEESSELSKRVMNSAIAQNINIIMDGTLSNITATEDKLNRFKKAGYNTELIHIDVSLETSIKRAKKRFLQSGRFVPFEVIASKEAQVQSSVDSIKDKVGKYSKIDNTGKTPKLVESLNNQFAQVPPEQSASSLNFEEQMERIKRYNNASNYVTEAQQRAFVIEETIKNVAEANEMAKAEIQSNIERLEEMEGYGSGGWQSYAAQNYVNQLQEELALLSEAHPDEIQELYDDLKGSTSLSKPKPKNRGGERIVVERRDRP